MCLGRASHTRERDDRLVLAVQLMAFLEGVKHAGALRVALTADYADLPLMYLLGAALGRFNVHEDRVKGALVLVVAYVLLFVVAPFYAADEPLHAASHAAAGGQLIGGGRVRFVAVSWLFAFY